MKIIITKNNKSVSCIDYDKILKAVIYKDNSLDIEFKNNEGVEEKRYFLLKDLTDKDITLFFNQIKKANYGLSFVNLIEKVSLLYVWLPVSVAIIALALTILKI